MVNKIAQIDYSLYERHIWKKPLFIFLVIVILLILIILIFSLTDNNLGISFFGENAKSVSGITKQAGESSFDSSGWISWAKDSHNSRIADDEVAPPLKLLWKQESIVRVPPQAGGEDHPYSNHDSDLYYKDDRLFHFRSWNIETLNATTGELLWKDPLTYGWWNVYSVWPRIILDDYILTGVGLGDHAAVTQGFNIYTGEKEDIMQGIMPGSIIIDESGIYNYGPMYSGVGYSPEVKALTYLYEPIMYPSSNGKLGGSFQFPTNQHLGYYKESDYLVLDDLGIEGNEFTLMFWVNATYSYDSLRKIISNSLNDPSFHDGYYVGLSNFNSSDYALNFFLFGSSSYYDSVNVDNFLIKMGEWTQVTITYDHENIKLYKNGKFITQYSETRDVTIKPGKVYIGANRRTNQFLGSLDEMAVFNNALTDSEIQSMYNSEIPDSSSNLELLYHFNNNPVYGENASFVYDYSGNNRNAVYDGHLNLKLKWPSNAITHGANIGNYGQLGIAEGIVVMPNGLIVAYNATNGSIIWSKGTSLINAVLGSKVYLGPAVYSNGVVYVFETTCTQEVLDSYYCKEYTSPCFTGFNIQTGNQVYQYCNENFNSWDDLINIGENYMETPHLYKYIISDNIVYIISSYQVIALDMTTSSVLWEKSVNSELGEVGDILLSGNYLYIADSYAGCIYAVDKLSGEEVWKFCGSVENSDIVGKERRVASLIESDNKIFVIIRSEPITTWGEFTEKIYAFEKGYENPKIINSNSKLPTGQFNVKYKSDSFYIENGEWPFNWEIVEGDLPAGLELINDKNNYVGLLNGTPIESGDFTFKARVTDARGDFDEKEFSLRILPDSYEFILDLQNGLNGYDGCIDNYLDYTYNNRNTNFGNSNKISLLESNNFKRGLLKFNIFESEGGPVPDDAIITSANFSLYKFDGYTNTISFYPLLVNWSESESTWYNSSSVSLWGSPGADGAGIDRESQIFNFTVSSSGNYLLPITELFGEYGTGLENKGWLLKGKSGSNLVEFASCDYYNISELNNGISKRPKLAIKYKRFNPDNQAPIVTLYANPSITSSYNLMLYANDSYDPDGEILAYEWSPSPGYYCKNYDYAQNGTCNYTITRSYLCAICENPPILPQYQSFCSNSYNLSCINMKYDYSVRAYDEFGVYSEGNSVYPTWTRINLIVGAVFDKTTITTTMLKKGEVNQLYSDYVYVGGSSGNSWSLIGSLPA
ncbi:MAG: LamG-like jellyroll fold domain-containing protein, partial [Candidatus Pacearchaeota archaeon]